MLLLERLMISSDAFEVNVCSECGLNGKNTRKFPYLEISFLRAFGIERRNCKNVPGRSYEPSKLPLQ